MDVVVFALAALSVAVLIQRLWLIGRRSRLRGQEQAYALHSLRDELQLLAIDGQIKADSPMYAVLIQCLNVGIKNAGKMRLREALQLAKRLEHRAVPSDLQQFVSEVQRQDQRVQNLVGKLLLTFAWMLVSNDWLVSAGVLVRRHVESSWTLVKPAAKAVEGLASAVFRAIDPARVEAVSKAEKYRSLAHTLGSC